MNTTSVQKPGEIDGVLVINKPQGMTSHDVINILRKKFKQKKFGHTGTLDPMATGVLVILAGKAVKLSQFLKDTDKSYEAGIALGAGYDTDDIWGEKTGEKPVNTDFDFEEVLASFQGKQHQKVPQTSAKKVAGKKLMEYQRQGLEVPEVYNDIEIYDIHPVASAQSQAETGSKNPDLRFAARCSSGTYIRSICRDFGEKTGNLAAMNALVRTSASGFDLSQAQDLETLTEENLVVYPMESVLDLPRISYEPIADIYNGKHVHIDTDADRVLIMDGDQLVAVYDRHHKDVFGCKRGLWA